MKLYHGTNAANAESLVATGTYIPRETDEIDPIGLWTSDKAEYAQVYGSCVVEIEVEEGDYFFAQDNPLDNGMVANEYVILPGVIFSARMAA